MTGTRSAAMSRSTSRAGNMSRSSSRGSVAPSRTASMSFKDTDPEGYDPTSPSVSGRQLSANDRNEKEKKGQEGSAWDFTASWKPGPFKSFVEMVFDSDGGEHRKPSDEETDMLVEKKQLPLCLTPDTGVNAAFCGKLAEVQKKYPFGTWHSVAAHVDVQYFVQNKDETLHAPKEDHVPVRVFVYVGQSLRDVMDEFLAWVRGRGCELVQPEEELERLLREQISKLPRQDPDVEYIQPFYDDSDPATAGLGCSEPARPADLAPASPVPVPPLRPPRRPAPALPPSRLPPISSVGEKPSSPLPQIDLNGKDGGSLADASTSGDNDHENETDAVEEKVIDRYPRDWAVDGQESWSSAHIHDMALAQANVEKKIDPKGRPIVFDRIAVGENVLHVAYLFRGDYEAHKIIRYLVLAFGPRIVNAPYQRPDRSPESPGRYDGETILHMAIVNRDYAMVRFLVEHGADLSARCYGTFFNGPSSEVLTSTYKRQSYMGEFPASFAVAVGDQDILRYLAAKGANLMCDRDSLGNYAAHIAVIHSRPEVLDLLLDELFHCGPVKDARKRYLRERVNHLRRAGKRNIPPSIVGGHGFKHGVSEQFPSAWEDFVLNKYFNSSNQTPFTLAASLNNPLMFTHMVFRERTLLWPWGPMLCFELNLERIDNAAETQQWVWAHVWIWLASWLRLTYVPPPFTPCDMRSLTEDEPPEEDTAGPSDSRTPATRLGRYFFSDMRKPQLSVLDIIVTNGYKDLLSGDIIVKVMTKKWNESARGWFYFNLSLYAALLVAFTLLCQHYRHGVFVPLSDYAGPVLKQVLWSVNVCRSLPDPNLPINPDGSFPPLVPGNGTYNCDPSTRFYRGSLYDLETTVLESIVFALVCLFTLFEAMDIVAYVAKLNDWQLRHASEDVIKELIGLPHVAPFVCLPDDCRCARNPKFAGATLVPSTRHKVPPTWGSQIRFFFEELELQLIRLLQWGFLGWCIYHYVAWQTNTEMYYNTDLALAAMTGWLSLLAWCRAFSGFGHFVVVLQQVFIRDLLSWITIYILFLAGFSLAMYVLIREQYINANINVLIDTEFNGFGTSLLRMFRHSIGDFAFDYVGANEVDNGVSTAILVGWTICGNVVMLNLLIALMSGTYKEITGDATRIWRLQSARIIQQMEDRFGSMPYHKSSLNPLRWPARLIKFLRWALVGAFSAGKQAGAPEPPKPYGQGPPKPKKALKFYAENPEFQQEGAGARHTMAPILEHSTSTDAHRRTGASSAGAPSLTAKIVGPGAAGAQPPEPAVEPMMVHLTRILGGLVLHPKEHHDKIESASFEYLKLLEKRKTEAEAKRKAWRELEQKFEKRANAKLHTLLSRTPTMHKRGQVAAASSFIDEIEKKSQAAAKLRKELKAPLHTKSRECARCGAGQPCPLISPAWIEKPPAAPVAPGAVQLTLSSVPRGPSPQPFPPGTLPLLARSATTAAPTAAPQAAAPPGTVPGLPRSASVVL